MWLSQQSQSHSTGSVTVVCSVCVSVALFVREAVCLWQCTAVCQCGSLSVWPSVCMAVCQCGSLSVCQLITSHDKKDCDGKTHAVLSGLHHLV